MDKAQKEVRGLGRRLLIELGGAPVDRTERELRRRYSQNNDTPTTPKQVSQALGWLKKRGLIVKEPRPADRAHRNLGNAFVLTDQGKALRDAMLSNRVAHELAEMQQADTENLAKLRVAWPTVWDELDARYNTPGGVIDGDKGKP